MSQGIAWTTESPQFGSVHRRPDTLDPTLSADREFADTIEAQETGALGSQRFARAGAPPDEAADCGGDQRLLPSLWDRRQNLKYPRNDGEAASAALRARALFDSVDSAVLLDSAALLADIENGIPRQSPAGKSVSGDDVLVVYLAGHGYALPDESGRE